MSLENLARLIDSLMRASPKLGLYFIQTIGLNFDSVTIDDLTLKSRRTIPDEIVEIFIRIDKSKYQMSKKEKAKVLADALILSPDLYIYHAKVLGVPITPEITYSEPKYISKDNSQALLNIYDFTTFVLNKHRIA